MFQITLHKNLNSYPRIMGVENHSSIKVTPKREIQCVLFSPPLVFGMIADVYLVQANPLNSSKTRDGVESGYLESEWREERRGGCE